jgi:bacteriocin-like protein
MSTDKKTETPKQQPKTKSPDSLIETTKKGDTELTEEELRRISGGDAASKDAVKIADKI